MAFLKRPQLTVPDAVDPRLAGVVIFPLHPSPELISETQISTTEYKGDLGTDETQGEKIKIKASLLCQKTSSKKSNDSITNSGLFFLILWSK